MVQLEQDKQYNRRDVLIVALVILGIIDTVGSIIQGREFHLVEKIVMFLFSMV